MRKIITLILMAVLFTGSAGCAKKPEGQDGKILAKINGYELTAKDFEDEVRLTAPNKMLSADPREAREELLDEIITKKVLLQEAQRQNFDKDKAFMKEIERYWEQALFKLMIRKKMEEISRSVVVEVREVQDEYDRMAKDAGGKIEPFEKLAPDIKDDIYSKKMKALFDGWMLELRKKADVKIYKENL